MISPIDQAGGGMEQDAAPASGPSQSGAESPHSIVDTANQFFVTARNDQVLVIRGGLTITPAEALNLAAWLFVMAEVATVFAGGQATNLDQFRALVEEIRGL